jgi:hypothetical protein
VICPTSTFIRIGSDVFVVDEKLNSGKCPVNMVAGGRPLRQKSLFLFQKTLPLQFPRHFVRFDGVSVEPFRSVRFSPRFIYRLIALTVPNVPGEVTIGRLRHESGFEGLTNRVKSSLVDHRLGHFEAG